MVDEYKSKDGQFRLLGGDLAMVRAERGAESLKSSRGVELVDLPFSLL